MSEDICKVLYADTDGTGREVSLVRLANGRWGILLKDECCAVGWPNGELAAATRAYRDLMHPGGSDERR